MVFLTDLFLVLEYPMFFLCFEAYPFIFKDTYTSEACGWYKSAMLTPWYRHVRCETWRSGTYAYTWQFPSISSIFSYPCPFFPQVGLGVTIVMVGCFRNGHFLAKAKVQGKTWASQEEYRRLPLVCVDEPLNAASQILLVSAP